MVSHILEAPTTKTTEEKSQRPFHYDFLFSGGTTPHDKSRVKRCGTGTGQRLRRHNARFKVNNNSKGRDFYSLVFNMTSIFMGPAFCSTDISVYVTITLSMVSMTSPYSPFHPSHPYNIDNKRDECREQLLLFGQNRTGNNQQPLRLGTRHNLVQSR